MTFFMHSAWRWISVALFLICGTVLWADIYGYLELAKSIRLAIVLAILVLALISTWRSLKQRRRS